MHKSVALWYNFHIFSFRPSLQSLHSDSGQLSEAIGRASSLAESVSSKVRILDLAKVCVCACECGFSRCCSIKTTIVSLLMAPKILLVL